jgi:hypothetical protein
MNTFEYLKDPKVLYIADDIYLSLNDLTKQSIVNWLSENGLSDDKEINIAKYILSEKPAARAASKKVIEDALAGWATAMGTMGLSAALVKNVIAQLSGEKYPDLLPRMTEERILITAAVSLATAVISLVIAKVAEDKRLSRAKKPEPHPVDSRGLPKNIRKSFTLIAHRIAKL